MTIVSLDTRRRTTIGGSDAADACNVGYRGRLMLWWEKLNGIEREDTESMWLGRALQERVAELVTERDGYEIMPAPADGFVHEAHPWMVCHPDGFTDVAGARAVAEIKTRGTGWTSEDEHELWGYDLQVQHGMAVTGCDVGLLAILHGGHGGMRLETRIIERNDEAIAIMIELEREIVDAVRTQTPPPRLGHKRDGETIDLMHPETTRPTVRLSGAGYEAVKELRARKEQLKDIERQATELEQRIQLEMGDAAAAYSPFDDNVAEWGMVEGHRFDTKRFRADHPEFDLDYYMPTRHRRFTLK